MLAFSECIINVWFLKCYKCVKDSFCELTLVFLKLLFLKWLSFCFFLGKKTDEIGLSSYYQFFIMVVIEDKPILYYLDKFYIVYFLLVFLAKKREVYVAFGMFLQILKQTGRVG